MSQATSALSRSPTTPRVREGRGHLVDQVGRLRAAPWPRSRSAARGGRNGVVLVGGGAAAWAVLGGQQHLAELGA